MNSPRYLLAVCLTFFLLGCGSSSTPTGKVSGTLIFENKPVTGGIINFTIPKEGRSGSAELGLDGSFAMPEPLPVGTYTVYISTPPGTPAGPDSKFVPPPPPPAIPKKYLAVSTSDLKATVAAGENNLKLEMKP